MTGEYIQNNNATRPTPVPRAEERGERRQRKEAK
jgi:hypothetical protein